MLKFVKRLFATLLVLSLCAGGIYFFANGGSLKKSDKEELPPADTSIAPSGVVLVTTAPVSLRQVQRTVESVGTLHGYEEVTIASKVEGRVLKIHHEMADRVKPSEVLLEIDPTDAELNAKQAERALQVELARLGLKDLPDSSYDERKLPAVQQASIRIENSKAKLERATKTGLAVSSEEINERRTELRLAQVEYENQLLLARAGLATVQLKAESLAVARQMLKDTTLRVPTPTQPIPGASSVGGDYAISQRLVSEGSFVRIGTDVFKLVIDQALKLRVQVPERYSSVLDVGQTVNVLSAAYPKAFIGLIKRISPAVDQTTRTFEVEVYVPNSDRQLKPGGFAKASILTKIDHGAVTVPLEAIVSFAGINKIFLMKDGKAREVQVTLGVQTTDWVEIIKPEIPAGSIVITSGQSALAQDSVVQVRPGATK
ncbi:efflux RND transporter periplasmic adaptor subunit [Telmatocola sphagniphila]|uniref:Efflux RND transporter periplasmic adaptor subunit n=1 Tax=Telmatocola sphagniphila TaxID=1123043 RepID=A0A8E6B830_9BACT|nr:efflux RND transporter periplasmic adaptor subunit [Telmatocola sphagniphila]QVL32268.1 efflux RND transporter periplasmic adaptor subunit [Telmatocola sphagniphila]